MAQLNSIQKIVQISGASLNGNDVFPIYQNSFSKFTINAPSLQTINALPPLLAPYGRYTLASTADVLFRQQIGTIPTDNPLIVFNDINGKKTGFICGEGIWRSGENDS